MKRLLRRGAVFVVGVSLLIAGFVLSLPLVPGPGLVVMLCGLGLLATEFDWARRLLARVKERAEATTERIRGGWAGWRGRGRLDDPDEPGRCEQPRRVASPPP